MWAAVNRELTLFKQTRMWPNSLSEWSPSQCPCLQPGFHLLCWHTTVDATDILLQLHWWPLSKKHFDSPVALFLSYWVKLCVLTLFTVKHSLDYCENTCHRYLLPQARYRWFSLDPDEVSQQQHTITTLSHDIPVTDWRTTIPSFFSNKVSVELLLGWVCRNLSASRSEFHQYVEGSIKISSNYRCKL